MFANPIKEIGASELAQWVSEPNRKLRVIDVREMHEIATGTVPKAVPVPLRTLPARIQELSRDEELVVVCRSGARSAQACLFLLQNGFSNVYNLRGGMMGWMQGGFTAC